MQRKIFLALVSVITLGLSHNVLVAYQATSTTGTTTTATTTTAGGAKTIYDGVFTADQAKRAEGLYTEKCANCHGAQLTGNDAPPLVGADFAGNWNGLTLDMLMDRIKLSMPADSPGSLSRQQVSDIIALMLAHAGAPAGAAELPTGADALKAITYAGTKP